MNKSIYNYINEFCIKYGFKYDDNKYIKYISDNQIITISFKDNFVIINIKFDNLKGDMPSIDYNNRLSIDHVSSFIYCGEFDITFSKFILYGINKIYNKIIFNNKNNITYLYGN